jgi:hypothetical protein
MRRKTFDLLAVIGGLVLAVVLTVAGGLLLWGHNFVSDQVHTQLAAQKIYFPPASSGAIKALPAADAKAMTAYAGQQMITGAQAQTYADHFIAVHLREIGGGKTYSQLATASLAQPRWRRRCRPSSAVRPCAACCSTPMGSGRWGRSC